MLKVNYDFIKMALSERRENLVNYGNIYSFGERLSKNLVDEMIKDIDEFLETTKKMCSTGDVYIEINSNSDYPVNNADVDICTLRLLDKNVFKKLNKGGFTESFYYVIIAVNAEQLDIVDLNNNEIYKQKDKLFTVWSNNYVIKKGSIVVEPVKYS